MCALLFARCVVCVVGVGCVDVPLMLLRLLVDYMCICDGRYDSC